MERAFLEEGAQQMARRWYGGARMEIAQPLEMGTSANRRVRHAGLQPALRHGKQPCGFARGKRLVKPEYSAIAAVALGAMDRKRGAKAAAIGRVCRGRNDVLAHGNSVI